MLTNLLGNRVDTVQTSGCRHYYMHCASPWPAMRGYGSTDGCKPRVQQKLYIQLPCAALPSTPSPLAWDRPLKIDLEVMRAHKRRSSLGCKHNDTICITSGEALTRRDFMTRMGIPVFLVRQLGGEEGLRATDKEQAAKLRREG